MNILYFGNYDPEYSRNRVLLKGLRENNQNVIEMRVTNKKLGGIWELYRKYI